MAGHIASTGGRFVVGGLVDVLAISKLSQVSQSASDKEQANYRQWAEAIVAQIPEDNVAWYLDKLRDDHVLIGQRAALLHRLNFRQRSFLLDQLDPKLRDRLVDAGVYKG